MNLDFEKHTANSRTVIRNKLSWFDWTIVFTVETFVNVQCQTNFIVMIWKDDGVFINDFPPGNCFYVCSVANNNLFFWIEHTTF